MTMDMVKQSMVEKIPFLNHGNLNDRFLSTMIFWHNKEWNMYADIDGKFVNLRAWPAENFYFGESAERPTDFASHFLNLTAQRACYLGLELPILGIRDDLFNISACVAKLKLMHDTKEQNKHGVCRMVATEVEYLYSLCRSMYDLLQDFASKLWARYKPKEPPKIPGKNRPKMYPELPKSFADMTLNDKVPRTADELVAKYKIPFEWANFYVQQCKFFTGIRHFRDNVVHNGSYVNHVMESEHGFLIQKDKKPFDGMNLWKEEEEFDNGIVLLMPAIGSVILHTLSALENFSMMLERNIAFPEPIVPGMHFYMRSYYDKELTDLLQDAIDRLEKKGSGAGFDE